MRLRTRSGSVESSGPLPDTTNERVDVSTAADIAQETQGSTTELFELLRGIWLHSMTRSLEPRFEKKPGGTKYRSQAVSWLHGAADIYQYASECCGCGMNLIFRDFAQIKPKESCAPNCSASS